jgi:hypothetical protein
MKEAKIEQRKFLFFYFNGGIKSGFLMNKIIIANGKLDFKKYLAFVWKIINNRNIQTQYIIIFWKVVYY